MVPKPRGHRKMIASAATRVLMLSRHRNDLSKQQSPVALKPMQNQALRKSAVKSRSTEVQRQSAPEEKIGAGRPQGGAEVSEKTSMDVLANLLESA
jgi:hypothetical protein